MRVLVTGGAGFIGRHLVKKLLLTEQVRQLVSVSRAVNTYPCDIPAQPSFFCATEVFCDLTQEKRVAELLARYKPDIIFHLAGNPRIKPDAGNPLGVIHSNVLATANLLAHCQEGTRFVLASSCAVYGDARTASPDGAFQESDDLIPTSIYGATKLMAEELVKVHDRMGHVNGLVIRLAATVGKGQTHGVLKDVIAKLKSDNEYLFLLGDAPGSHKPYTHISDVIDAFIRFGLNPDIGGAVNVSNEDTLSIRDLAEKVQDAIGITKPIRWLGAEANWVGDNPIVCVNSSRAQDLGWNPEYPTSALAIGRAAKDLAA